MPDLKHAELIDGIVYTPSPAGNPHSTVSFDLCGWLAQYMAATPGCDGGTEGTWLMGKRNVPQPDSTLRISPQRGGQSRDEGEYTAGAPELLVEVAASSRDRDLSVKLKLYERMGVCEYLVAETGQRQIHWKELVDGKYQPLEPGPDGIFRSRCFPGLWLEPEALRSRDLPRLFAVVEQGLATPEHTAFAARLANPNF